MLQSEFEESTFIEIVSMFHEIERRVFQVARCSSSEAKLYRLLLRFSGTKVTTKRLNLILNHEDTFTECAKENFMLDYYCCAIWWNKRNCNDFQVKPPVFNVQCECKHIKRTTIRQLDLKYTQPTQQTHIRAADCGIELESELQAQNIFAQTNTHTDTPTELVSE